MTVSLNADAHSKRTIPPLTGIRGYAALWVCVFHFYPLAAKWLGLPAIGKAPIIRDGFMGVDLFFILSGFVLMMSYGASVTGKNGLKKFAIGRFFRILPLHWVALGILVILVTLYPGAYWGPGPFTLKSLAACFFLVQSWGVSTSIAWNNPEWSLSAEWLAYLLFPLIALALTRIKSPIGAIVLAFLSGTGLATIFLASHSTTIDHAELGGLIRCFAEFFAGACLCTAWRKLSLRPSYGTWLIFIGCAGLAACLAYPILQLGVPFAFGVLVLGCAIPSRTADRIFANPVAMILGDISFSLYLTHSIIINAADHFIPHTSAPYGTLTGLMGTILAVSYLSWRFVEHPSQLLGKSISRRLITA